MDGRGQQFARIEFPPIVSVTADADWEFGIYAQHAVLTCLANVLNQRQAVWDNASPDGVHDIRVAARRCRTAMQAFSTLWADGDVNWFAKQLGRFADAFGRARDLDVLIRHLREQLAGDPSALSPAQAWLLGLNQGLRRSEQQHLQAALRRFEHRELPRRMVGYFSKHPVDLWALKVPHG